MKYFCFRFDVDTYRGMRKGVPNLIELAATLGVNFTFFINMGRSISRYHYFEKILRKGNNNGNKLSSLKKMGYFNFLITGVFNPKVGASYPHMLKYLAQEGHEIGLHGGCNHGTWQVEASQWSKTRMRKEIYWGLREFEKINITPKGFASPGWNSPDKLKPILEEFNFIYVADRYGDDEKNLVFSNTRSDFIDISTNIVGEPGGVGYIENLKSYSFSDEEVLDIFQNKLIEIQKAAIVYDHPVYAGIQKISLVKKMVLLAQELDFQVTPLHIIIKELIT